MKISECLKFPSGPLNSVYLLDGYERRPMEEGGDVSIADVLGLSKHVLLAVLRKTARLSANEFVFLRERLDLLQSEIGSALGVDKQTVSLWERGLHPVPKACDVVLRTLVLENERKLNRRALAGIGVTEFARHADCIASAVYFAKRKLNGWELETRLNFAEYRSVGSSSVAARWEATPQLDLAGQSAKVRHIWEKKTFGVGEVVPTGKIALLVTTPIMDGTPLEPDIPFHNTEECFALTVSQLTQNVTRSTLGGAYGNQSQAEEIYH